MRKPRKTPRPPRSGYKLRRFGGPQQHARYIVGCLIATYDSVETAEEMIFLYCDRVRERTEAKKKRDRGESESRYRRYPTGFCANPYRRVTEVLEEAKKELRKIKKEYKPKDISPYTFWFVAAHSAILRYHEEQEAFKKNNPSLEIRCVQ